MCRRRGGTIYDHVRYCMTFLTRISKTLDHRNRDGVLLEHVHVMRESILLDVEGSLLAYCTDPKTCLTPAHRVLQAFRAPNAYLVRQHDDAVAMNARGVERVPFMELGSFCMGSWCSARKCGGHRASPWLLGNGLLACSRALVCDARGQRTCRYSLNEGGPASEEGSWPMSGTSAQ